MSAVPYRVITIPGVRIWPAGIEDWWTNVTSAILTSASLNRGFYGAPWLAPPELDPTRPIYAYTLSTRVPGVFTGDANLEHSLLLQRATPGATPSTVTVTNVHPVPTDWPLNEVARWLFDNGNGCTLDPHQLEVGQVLGTELQRNGSATGDTFPIGTKLLYGIELHYPLACRFGDCL